MNYLRSEGKTLTSQISTSNELKSLNKESTLTKQRLTSWMKNLKQREKKRWNSWSKGTKALSKKRKTTLYKSSRKRSQSFKKTIKNFSWKWEMRIDAKDAKTIRKKLKNSKQSTETLNNKSKNLKTSSKQHLLCWTNVRKALNTSIQV